MKACLRVFLLGFCAMVACSRPNATGQSTARDLGSGAGAGITATDLRRHVETLADDSLGGRETGSAGDFKAADYVAREFARLGLRPAGENGTYFQTVPFWTVAVDAGTELIDGATRLTTPGDILPAVPTNVRSIDDAPVIFGGTVGDPGHWIPAEQAAGKIVILLLPGDAPARGFPANPARFPGAAALAVAGLDHVAPEQTARLMVGRPVASPTLNDRAVPGFWISYRALTGLFGKPVDALAPGAIGHTVKGRVGFVARPVAFPVRNVIAVLPGRDPTIAGEYVSLTAHHDHVGFDHQPVDHDSIRAHNRVMRPMGADSPVRDPNPTEQARIRVLLDSLRRLHPPRLDSIRNGADDDGTGTASILEIAEAISRGERPRRSILFVSHAAEEAGLLGSAYFTDHVTVPIDSIVAEIDQDMVGRGLPDDYPRGADAPPASKTYLELIGDQKLSMEFSRFLDAANARQPVPFAFDRSTSAPGHPLQYYCRADHYNYARYGIPSAALSRGEHLDYHQVTDEARYISYPDLARVSQMVHDAAMAIANADRRPALDVPKPSDPHTPCRQ